jgi:hypothetical protein
LTLCVNEWLEIDNINDETQSLTTDIVDETISSQHSESHQKKERTTNMGRTKTKAKAKMDFSVLSAKTREEIVEHIKWGHPCKSRLVQSIAREASATPSVVRQYWKAMAKTKAKNTLSQREPAQTFRMPNRNSLLRPIRRNAYTEFRHHLKTTYTCNYQRLLFFQTNNDISS